MFTSDSRFAQRLHMGRVIRGRLCQGAFVPKPVCKPSSVAAHAAGDHLSGMPVARHLKRPTQGHRRAACWRTNRPALLFGLAPGGVCL